MSNENKVLKAEYPLNLYGLGYRSTLENGPYFKEDVGYIEPLDNSSYTFCGACAFYNGGRCEALEEDVQMLASCKLYISMSLELDLRHTQLLLQTQASSEATVKSEKSEGDLEKVEKYISKENGKYCVRSHQTGKSFGCYSTRAQAEKRLAQIQRFKDEKDIPHSAELEVKFASMDEEKRLVYGVVLVPDDVDTYEDTVSEEEIEKAAHKYMLKPMVIGDGHTKKAKANPVESFIYNPKVIKNVKPGSWVMAIKVHSDAIWQGIKDGDYTGLSIGAMVRRRNLDQVEEE